MSNIIPTPKQPRWREISGLTVETEKSLPDKDRRAAIRKLQAAAESEIRAELLSAEQDNDFKSERTYLWEPSPAVCRRLEIAPTALNRLLKELSGLTVAQLADKIRAEGLREKLRADLIEHIKNRQDKPGSRCAGAANFLVDFWQELKARRAEPDFNYATRAIGLGFQNYTRLYRACILQYGLTPTQLEHEILREFATFFACAAQLIRRRNAKLNHNQNNQSFDKHRQPYSDTWAQAAQDNPAWLTQNRETFGLADEAAAWV